MHKRTLQQDASVCYATDSFTSAIRNELGGGYFFVNALVSVCSWFAAAAVYVRYSLAEATELALRAGMNTSMANYSALVSSTGASSSGGNSTGGTLSSSS